MVYSSVDHCTSHEYYKQVQGQLEICNRAYCDFACWTPVWSLYHVFKKEFGQTETLKVTELMCNQRSDCDCKYVSCFWASFSTAGIFICTQNADSLSQGSCNDGEQVTELLEEAFLLQYALVLDQL